MRLPAPPCADAPSALDAVVSEQEIAKTARRQGFRNAPKDGQRCSADRGRQARCTSTPGGWSTAWRKAILDRERRTAAAFQKHRTSQRAFAATVRRRSAPSRGFAQPFRRRGRHQATFPKTERSANHFGVLRMAMRSQLVVLGRLDRENATALIRDEERDADLSARPWPDEHLIYIVSRTKSSSDTHLQIRTDNSYRTTAVLENLP